MSTGTEYLSDVSLAYPDNSDWGIPDPELPVAPQEDNWGAMEEWKDNAAWKILDVNHRRDVAKTNFGNYQVAKQAQQEHYYRSYVAGKMPFLGAMVPTAAKLSATDAARKMDAGLVVSADEMDGLAYMNTMQEAAAQRGFFGFAGDIAASIPGYAIEFGIGGGFGLLAEKGAGEFLMESAAKQMAGHAASKALLKSAAKTLGPKTLRRAAKFAAFAAGTAAWTAAQPQRIAQSYVNLAAPEFNLNADERQRMGHMIVAESKKEHPLILALLDTGIETFTERLGGVLLDPLMEAMHGNAFIQTMRKMKLVPKPFEKMASQWGGIDSYFSELMEERIGDAMRMAVPGLSDQTGVLGDLIHGEYARAVKQQAAEALAFAAIPGFNAAAAKFANQPGLTKPKDVKEEDIARALKAGLITEEEAGDKKHLANRINEINERGAAAMNDDDMAAIAANPIHQAPTQPPSPAARTEDVAYLPKIDANDMGVVNGSPEDTAEMAAEKRAGVVQIQPALTFKSADVPDGVDIHLRAFPSMTSAYAVDLARRVGASVDLNHNLTTSLGRMSGETGSIEINPEVGQLNSAARAFVINHEISHLDRILTQETLKELGYEGKPLQKAVALGRKIRAMNESAKRFFSDRPGGQKEMNNEQLGEWEEFYREMGSVRQLVRDREAITIDDVGKIYDHLATRRPTSQNKQIISYIKNLPGSQQQEIMNAAIMGYVRGDVRLFKRFKEQLKKPTKKNISEKLAEHILEHAKRHKMHDQDAILDELVALTKWLRPAANWGNMTKRARGQFLSSEELMANAQGLFLTSPGVLRERAPQFFDAYVKYMKKHKLFGQYADLVGEIYDRPLAIVERAMKKWEGEDVRANDALIAFWTDATSGLKSLLSEGMLNSPALLLLDKNAASTQRIRKHRKQEQKQFDDNLKATNPNLTAAERQARFKDSPVSQEMVELEQELDNSYRNGNVDWVIRMAIDKHIIKPIEDAGMTMHDINNYLRAQRIKGRTAEDNASGEDEGGRISFEFFGHEEAAKIKQALMNNVGQENYTLLHNKMQELHRKYLFPYVQRMYDAGMLTPLQYQNAVEHKDDYSFFQTLTHLQQNLGTVSGTFIPIKGMTETAVLPLDMTLEKMTKIQAAIGRQTSKQTDKTVLDWSNEAVPISEGQTIPPGYSIMSIFEGEGQLNNYMVPRSYGYKYARNNEGTWAWMEPVTRFFNTITYRFAQPIFITFSPRFLVKNPLRDAQRTWRLAGTRVAQYRAAYGHRLAAQRLKDAEKAGKHYDAYKIRRRAHMDAQKAVGGLGVMELAGETIKAFGEVWKAENQGETHPVYAQLMEDRRIDVPFVMAVNEMNEIADQEKISMGSKKAYEMKQRMLGISEDKQWGVEKFLSRLAQQHHAIGPLVQAAASVPIKSMKFMERFGRASEMAGKIAAENLLVKHNIPKPYRVETLRWQAGTPDFRIHGYGTPITNGLILYSKVGWNGIRGEARLMKDLGKEAYAGEFTGTATYLMRTAMVSGVMTSINVLAGYKAFDWLFGDWWSEYMNKIPHSYIDNFTTIPLGYIPVGDGERKPLMICLPMEQELLFFNKFLAHSIRHLIELKSEQDRVSVEESAKEMGKELLGNYVAPGSGSPLINMLTTNVSAALGNNPTDPFFGSKIFNQTTQQAGGIPRFLALARWNINQLGVIKELFNMADFAFTSAGGREMQNYESYGELTLKAVPGINGFFKISDRGTSDYYYHLKQIKATEQAQFKQSLPKVVRGMTHDLALQRSIMDQLPESERTRALVIEHHMLEDWNAHVYRKLRTAIIANQEAGHHEQAAVLMRRLGEISQDRRKAIRRAINRVK